MPLMTVRLFGSLELRHGTAPAPPFATRWARGIFSYLVLHRGRFFSRELLCGTFWRESSANCGRKRLRTALWRIRRLLEEIDVDPDGVLRCERSRVGIPGYAPVRVDVEQFEERTRSVISARAPTLDSETARDAERAVALYRGDLLEGEYGDWCCAERERLRLRLLTVLERLMVHHRGRREWTSAIRRGCQVLRRDPLREHVHREVMRCHYAMGNRPAAIRQYRECVRILDREVEVDPMLETRRLLELIRSEGPLEELSTRGDERVEEGLGRRASVAESFEGSPLPAPVR